MNVTRVTLRFPVPDRFATSGLRFRRKWLPLQSLCFDALAELLYADGELGGASASDDQETAIERRVYAEMQACGCPCCRLHLPRLLDAERYDRDERRLHESARRRNREAAASTRGLSALVDGALVREASGTAAPKQLRTARAESDDGGFPDAA